MTPLISLSEEYELIKEAYSYEKSIIDVLNDGFNYAEKTGLYYFRIPDYRFRELTKEIDGYVEIKYKGKYVIPAEDKVLVFKNADTEIYTKPYDRTHTNTQPS